MKYKTKPHLVILFLFLAISLHTRSQVFIPADNLYIDYYGRWDMSDPAHPNQSWSAVYLKVRFTGTSIGIRMDDNYDYFNVYIDGDFVKVFRGSQSSEADYVLASGLNDTIHTLLLTKRNSTFDQYYSIAGFNLEDGKEILPPAPRNIRKIEFLGDSWTAAMGNEAEDNNVPWEERVHVTDTDDGFANIIARYFNAQYHLICRAGIGLAVDWQGSYDMVLYDRLDRTLMDEEEPKWDFKQYIPDLVVICLGINDNAGFSSMSDPISEENSAFYRERYHAYINTIRSVYPGTEFVLVATEIPWLRQNVQLVVDEEHDMGYHDVYYAQCDYFPGGYVAEDHPSVETHYKIAEQIIEYIEDYNIIARESFAKAVNEAPVIDGVKDELWDHYTSYDLGNIDSLCLATNREDVFVSFKAIWDTTNIYLYAEITDDSLTSTAGNQNDKLEIYFDLNNSKIKWDAGSAACDTCPMYDSDDKMFSILYGTTSAGFTNAQALTDTGWIIEAAIPWDSIGDLPAVPGMSIGFDMCYRDNDKSGIQNILTYSDYKGDAYKDASKFGNLFLLDSSLITFDGTINNGEIWDHLTPFQINKKLIDDNLESTGDFSAYFKSYLADSSLYVLIEIKDDSIFTINDDATQNDYLKLCFDFNNSKNVKIPRNSNWEESPDIFDTDDIQIILQPGKDTIIGPENAVNATQMVQTISSDSVTFELKFSLNSFAYHYPDFEGISDNETGFDIIAFDNDNEDPDMLSWNTVTVHGNNDPVMWGTLTSYDDKIITPVIDLVKPDRISGINFTYPKEDYSEIAFTWNRAEDNLVSDDCKIVEEDFGIDTTIRYDTAYTVTGVSAGSKYRFFFRAVDYAGNQSLKLSRSITVPTVSDLRSPESTDDNFSIYPNPVKNTLYISNNKNIREIDVFNITGQTVTIPAKNNYSELDFSGIMPGIYILRITSSDGETANIRLMKH